MSSKTKKLLFYPLLILGVLVLFFIVFSYYPRPTEAAGTCPVGMQCLYGWAWSSNIGWISFNCGNLGTCGTADYKVWLDKSVTPNQLHGFAWASNPGVGWIQFDPVGPYPGAPNSSAFVDPSDTTNTIQGWARVCSGSASPSTCSGGAGPGNWDGWIKLSDISPVAYGVTINNAMGELNGYAWGSDVVGWVSFCDKTLPNPYCVSFNPGAQPPLTPAVANITASPSSITRGQPSDLNWSCINSTSAGIDNGVMANQVCNGSCSGTEPVSPVSTTQYTLTCSNGLGDVSYSANVTVSGPSPTPTPIPVANLSAAPQVIARGQSSTLTWSCTDSTSANIDNSVMTNPSCGGVCNGTEKVSPPVSTAYTLTCTSNQGGVSVATQITVKVQVGTIREY